MDRGAETGPDGPVMSFTRILILPVPHPDDVETEADIVTIVGDLAPAPDCLEPAARLFPHAPTLVTTGANH